MNRNPLVAGAATLLGLALFAFLVVLPRGAEVGEVQAQIDDAEATLTELQASLAELQAFQASGNATSDLAEIRSLLPPTADLAELLRLLQSAADASGVTLQSVTPGIPTPASAGSASTIPLGISATGEYFALARFAFAVENLPRLARVNAISIASDGEGKSLALQLTAEVYTTDLSAGPGSDPAGGAEVGA